MNASATDSAQALFDGERLPFPPVPALLAASLQPQGPGWFATRPVDSSPYDLDHFLAELETPPGPPDYAVVGFDGHGSNSWAAHFYLVGQRIALFIQLPWGGAYLEPEQARANIADLFDWAEALQSRLQLAEAARKIPDGTRLQVVATQFGRAGWRWLEAGQDAAATPWNPSAGMKATILQELDDLRTGPQSIRATVP